MRLLAEAIPPVNPVTTTALAALFALCALVVAIGIIKLVDAFSRALFGTISGAVGWIPFAGRLVKRDLHKIEQKISHGLGSAERKLDAGVAWTWNNCAHLVAYVGTEIEGGAKIAWHLAQQAQAFVRGREMHQSIRAGVKPGNAKAVSATHVATHAQAGVRDVRHSVATGVYPRIKSAEWEIDHVLEPGLEAVRARTRALEHGAIRTFEWLNSHRRGVAASVFTGAVAWALTRLGGGWIRCANWRKLGKTVCRLPSPIVDALIAALLAEVLFSHLDTLLEYAGESIEETTRVLYQAFGLGDLPNGRFTVE